MRTAAIRGARGEIRIRGRARILSRVGCGSEISCVARLGVWRFYCSRDRLVMMSDASSREEAFLSFRLRLLRFGCGLCFCGSSDQRLGRREGVGFDGGFVPADAMDAREAHGDA